MVSLMEDIQGRNSSVCWLFSFHYYTMSSSPAPDAGPVAADTEASQASSSAAPRTRRAVAAFQLPEGLDEDDVMETKVTKVQPAPPKDELKTATASEKKSIMYVEQNKPGTFKPVLKGHSFGTTTLRESRDKDKEKSESGDDDVTLVGVGEAVVTERLQELNLNNLAIPFLLKMSSLLSFCSYFSQGLLAGFALYVFLMIRYSSESEVFLANFSPMCGDTGRLFLGLGFLCVWSSIDRVWNNSSPFPYTYIIKPKRENGDRILGVRVSGSTKVDAIMVSVLYAIVVLFSSLCFFTESLIRIETVNDTYWYQKPGAITTKWEERLRLWQLYNLIRCGAAMLSWALMAQHTVYLRSMGIKFAISRRPNVQ